MKTIYLILLISFYSINIVAQYYQEVYDIETPMGDNVTDTGEYLLTEPTYSEAQIATMRNALDRNYGGAELLGIPSPSYNCHAYAWHISEGGRLVWIGLTSYTAEDIYWTGYSYEEVELEEDALKVSYPENPGHSAITTDTQYWYISKWGDSYLVRHEWDEVPTGYLPQGESDYDDLTFYESSDPTDTIYLEDVTYDAGFYLNGVNIEIENVTIDIDNLGWITIDAENNVLITGDFEVTLGSTFIVE